MALSASDIKFYLSGGGGNSDPNASLGGAISSTEVTGDTLNNLFDDISGVEARAGDTEYRCFYVKNTNGVDSSDVSKLWISTVPNSRTSPEIISIGLTIYGKNGTAQTIVDESSAPSGVNFFPCLSNLAGLSMPILSPGDYEAIWVRRVVPVNCAPALNTYVVFTFENGVTQTLSLRYSVQYLTVSKQRVKYRFEYPQNVKVFIEENS
jgi:hypothetical protein